MMPDAFPRKGQVLRVKKGYNPNSSSIGSDIKAFLAFGACAGVMTVFIMNTLNSVGRLIKKNKDHFAPQKAETPPTISQ